MNKDLLIIRKVKETDARGWHMLANKVWKDAYKNIFPEEVFIEKENKLEEKVKGFKDRIINNNKNIAYVAEYNNEIIGIMSGCISAPYENFNNYAELIGLYIDKDFQGYGIGTKFKNIFEEWINENNVNKYIIGVLKDNKKAQEVYKSWGGTLSNYEEDFIKLDKAYKEVFYIFNL